MIELKKAFAIVALVALTACGGGAGQVGDECETDADCADGLECHAHDHGDEVHGECEDHGDE